MALRPEDRLLSVHDVLGPVRVRLLGGSVLAELTARFGVAARAKVLAGEVVDDDGAVVDSGTVLPPGSVVHLYRDLPDEVPVPFDVPVLHQDADIVVVDKPHFLATMPRGRHVAQTALVRLRRELGLPELSPAHRLDRLTPGCCCSPPDARCAAATRRCSPAVWCARPIWLAHPLPRVWPCRAWSAVASSSAGAICRRSVSPAFPTRRRWWSG